MQSADATPNLTAYPRPNDTGWTDERVQRQKNRDAARRMTTKVRPIQTSQPQTTSRTMDECELLQIHCVDSAVGSHS